MYKKNDKVELEIIDMTSEGLGLAKLEGQVFFVKDGVVGDKVLANITKVNKDIIFAKTLNVLVESKFRVKSKCSISNSCGGCQLLNIDFNKQLELKKKNVLKNITRIGKFEESEFIYDELVYMDDPCHFRNKMQIPFSKHNGEIIYGFYAGRTHHIVPFDWCMVGFIGAENILEAIKLGLKKYGISIYDEESHTGVFREVLLRCANNTNEVSITYILNDDKIENNLKLYKEFDLFVIEEATKLLNNNNKYYNDDKVNRKESRRNALLLKFATSTININTENNNVLFGNKNVIIRGGGYIEDFIGDVKYHISPESFYQINNQLTKRLYDKVVEYGQFDNSQTVLDLYCGIGTISLYVANRVKKVIGVEIVKKAIENANSNKALNQIDNADFVNMDLSENFTELKKLTSDTKIDAVIVDPPRKGLSDESIKFIKELFPTRLIYVSCESSTLSRDLNLLCHEGENKYKLKKVSNFDMFAHTTHIETVCLLEKNYHE